MTTTASFLDWLGLLVGRRYLLPSSLEFSKLLPCLVDNGTTRMRRSPRDDRQPVSSARVAPREQRVATVHRGICGFETINVHGEDGGGRGRGGGGGGPRISFVDSRPSFFRLPVCCVRDLRTEHLGLWPTVALPWQQAAAASHWPDSQTSTTGGGVAILP